MGKTENHPTWTCDRCKTAVAARRPPHTPTNCWGKLKLDQDAGWDSSGAAWAPRVREPIELCGACIEDIVAIINYPRQPINIVMAKPPGPDTDFVEAETDDGKGINAGEWSEREDGLWALRITELPKR